MDAYDILNQNSNPAEIDFSYFYELIIRFRKDYFINIDYSERLSKHRKPVSFLNELLQGKNGSDGLYRHLQKIQGREEMRDFDAERNSMGFVNTKIEEILEEDKNVKTLYEATRIYCKKRSKIFDIVAVHVAEYRAMNIVLRKIDKEIEKLLTVKVKQNTSSKAASNNLVDPNQNKLVYHQLHLQEMMKLDKLFYITEMLTPENAQKHKVEYQEDVTISFIPEPQNHADALRYFTGYIGPIICSIYKNEFYQKYGSWLESNIKAEIAYMEKFMSEAHTKSYKEAVEAVGHNNDNNYFCYLRLKNSYYDHNNFSPHDLDVCSLLVKVYGRYFLLYDYLVGLNTQAENAAASITYKEVNIRDNSPNAYTLYSNAVLGKKEK